MIAHTYVNLWIYPQVQAAFSWRSLAYEKYFFKPMIHINQQSHTQQKGNLVAVINNENGLTIHGVWLALIKIR